MATVELRPLSLGELLDRTFTIYRSHFWVFVGIMAVPAAFAIPVNYLVLSFQGTMMSATNTPRVPSPTLIFGVFAGLIVYAGFLLLVQSIALAAVTHAISEAYLGRNATVRDSYRSLKGKFWRLIGVDANIILRLAGIFLLVVFVVVVIPLIAITLIPGFGGQQAVSVVIGILTLLLYLFAFAACGYLALRYALSIPALMIENLGILPTIRRSVQLTRGRRGHIFIAFLLSWIIGMVGYIVLQAPFSIATMYTLFRNHNVPDWLALATSVAGAVGAATTGSISMIVLVLCYYDTRIRKEAFDLQFMMTSLGEPPTAPAAGTVTPA